MTDTKTVALDSSVKSPRRPRGDLRATTLGGFSWAPDECESSLGEIYRHVREDALDAIRWYQKARRPKRRTAVAARFLAVVLLGTAGVLPLLDVAISALAVPAIWISIFVATGAGALAFDRFHGASTGWIRYIKSELQIRTALEVFELDWEAERVTWAGQRPTTEQVKSMLGMARDFAVAINRIIQDETNAWVEEFQRSIQQIDRALKARADAAEERRAAEQPGALNLVVTNGDQCDNGWEVDIDEGVARLRFTGQSGALADLPEGIRVIRVAGIIGGQERRANVAAPVKAGSVTEQRITLS